ncbi:MAG: hypothetical protein PVH12_02205 [Candidatus Bathyarchaeota archaeon]|jgi:hypothetical protein
MPARKMRIELFDSEGNKYTISFEGQVTRDKAVRLLDLVELLGGTSLEGTPHNLGTSMNEITKYEKMRVLVHNSFPVGWFTSKEVQTVYEREIRKPIGLSTVSTYLSRMTERGMLVKVRESRQLKYRISRGTASEVIEGRISQ